MFNLRLPRVVSSPLKSLRLIAYTDYYCSFSLGHHWQICDFRHGACQHCGRTDHVKTPCPGKGANWYERLDGQLRRKTMTRVSQTLLYPTSSALYAEQRSLLEQVESLQRQNAELRSRAMNHAAEGGRPDDTPANLAYEGEEGERTVFTAQGAESETVSIPCWRCTTTLLD